VLGDLLALLLGLITIIFFPYLSWLAGIEGTAFHTTCMKCVERNGFGACEFWGLGFEV
jgi:hypothetical protein